ncbi:uracil-DNA glycosylase-like protein [Lipomyces chichibuensis]|uniref:uracil-DNA glycosylase-like protein n=1 Tax=Lipomyces chichibuensis TaxID=1546026 RepID=UPI0033437986
MMVLSNTMAQNEQIKDESVISFNGLLDRFACIEGDPTSIPATASPTKSSLPDTPSDSVSSIEKSSSPSLSSRYFSTPSKVTRKRKVPRRYAPPALYAHLAPVPDCLAPNLICIFVGLNPGVMTSQKQHMFANPTNLFWPLLFESGCVARKLTCVDDRQLPMDWSLGITNLISRTTAEQSELSKDEMVRSAGELESKLRCLRPSAICIVGKGIWEAIYRFKAGKSLKQEQFKFGWQDLDEFQFAAQAGDSPKVFVVPSTSGRVAAYSRSMKAELWKDLGEYIKTIRDRHLINL